MTPEERFQIVRSVGEECIQEDELLNLLTKKPQPICYDGFEPSGRMHIAQVCISLRAVNVGMFCILSSVDNNHPKHPISCVWKKIVILLKKSC